MNFINDVEEIAFRLECAIDNLISVHSCMEDDGGANWERHCNAVFSAYLQLCSIQRELDRRIDSEVTQERKRRGME